MSDVALIRELRAAGSAATSPVPGPTGRRLARVGWIDPVEQGQFLAMERAFESTGGVASGDEIAQRLRGHSDQPISAVARWIVDREVVSFRWRSKILLPLFQFEGSSMTLRPGMAEVILELSAALDDWELAAWFAQPSAWLDGAAPVDTISHDPHAVLQAARADRFIALGS